MQGVSLATSFPTLQAEAEKRSTGLDPERRRDADTLVVLIGGPHAEQVWAKAREKSCSRVRYFDTTHPQSELGYTPLSRGSVPPCLSNIDSFGLSRRCGVTTLLLISRRA